MKKLSFACLLASLLFGLRLAAQPCEYFALVVDTVPGNPCQFEISVIRTDSIPGWFDEIVLSASDTNSFFTEAIAADTNIVGSVNGDYSEAIFTTNFNLGSLPLNVEVPIGTLTTTSPAGQLNFGGSIRGSGGVVCTFGGFSFPIPCTILPPVSTFYKLYGNPAEDNCPTKVKGFNGFTYVLSARKTATTQFPVFSKFTNAGVLIWEKQLDTASQLLDFEYTGPFDNSFLLVGRSEPISSGGTPVDNASMLVKIDDLGNLGFIKFYEHLGRESFTRIVRNTRALPTGTPYQFYVLGHKNPTPPPVPPNTVDQPMLYNFDNAGNERTGGFAFFYNYAFELEGHLGMFPKANGNVVILGAAAPNNDGVLIEINGQTGAVVNAFVYNDASNTGYDFWDGLELSANGDVVIAGTHFNGGNSTGILLKLNNAYALTLVREFPNISEYHEIGRDPQGRFYVVGPAKVPPATMDFPVVSRIAASNFSVVYSAYYKRGEQDWQNPHFYVNPSASRIFYADARKTCNSPNQWDMLVGAFDLNFSIQNPLHNCRLIFSNPTTTPTLFRTAVTVTASVLTKQVSPAGNLITAPLACNPFCPVPSCLLSFTWTTGACRNVQFTSTTSNNACPSATVTYAWNTGGGNPTTSSLPNPTVVYPAAGTYNVCLTVTVSDPTIGYNCTVTQCQNVIVPAAALPTCTPPANITVNTNPGVCYAALSPQVSGTGCPTLSISASANNGVGPWSGGSPLTLAANYPKGTTTVNATVTDG
ncbi:MAG: PKD domain-containing protein, partial [Bacteroidota bacterium]